MINQNYNIYVYYITVLLYASFNVLSTNSLGSRIILVEIAAFLIIIIILRKGIIKIIFTKFHIYMICFALFCSISSLWALNSNAAIAKGMTIFQIFICLSVIMIYYMSLDSGEILLKVLMYGSYLVLLYILCNYGIHNILYSVANGFRLSSDIINSNTVGLAASTSALINLHFSIKNRKLNVINLLIPFSILMIAVSGSRKAIIYFILGIVVLTILHSLDDTDKFKKLINLILTILIIFLIINITINLPMFELIKVRLEGMAEVFIGRGSSDNSSMLRKNMIIAGIDAFIKHPVLGSGIGCSSELLELKMGLSTYMHNNYVEILACGGIVGTICFYYMHFYILKGLIRYRKYRDKDYPIYLTLILLTLLMDLGMVSYYDKGTYFLLMTCFLYVKKLKSVKSRLREKDSII